MSPEEKRCDARRAERIRIAPEENHEQHKEEPGRERRDRPGLFPFHHFAAKHARHDKVNEGYHREERIKHQHHAG